ncbi:Spherulation-specific family 4 [Triangularia setosa]|uniref:Spherulation-specific family 4 n=1 Tax=Triangularia setosa TaxID=2587417 RepID=A0AAN7A588_9PEZI|nr:Spherulation-specific family 4 [Podospora setosa]
MTKLLSRTSSSLSSSSTTTTTKPFILVPLYIYPDPGAWAPLIQAAHHYPNLQFIVVVNPNNGPGDGEKPDENYVSVLHQLRDLSNVRLIGYVYCSYGKRNLEEMGGDVRRYQVWECEKRGCGVSIKGVFFDEAPADTEHVEYMASAASSVRGILGRESMVVYNPGVFPDYRYYDSGDYVVPFENVAREWWGEYARENVKNMPRELKEKSVVIAHSCKEGERGQILEEVRKERWGGHFLTGEGGYERWDGGWGGNIAILDSCIKRTSFPSQLFGIWRFC